MKRVYYFVYKLYKYYYYHYYILKRIIFFFFYIILFSKIVQIFLEIPFRSNPINSSIEFIPWIIHAIATPSHSFDFYFKDTDRGKRKRR